MTRTLDWAKIFAALADPTRLKIVELLSGCDEMSGMELAERLEISLALFCHHSKILVEAGLVKKRKQGLLKYHALNREILQDCIGWLETLAVVELEDKQDERARI